MLFRSTLDLDGSDASVGREGWYIDDVKVQGCSTTDVIFADGFELPVQ